MINASGKINSVAQKRTQTDWDLSSSITGTVKRRPSSLESCKSSSPTDSSDFPNDAPLKSESPSIKKRILKLPESARKSISTKLKLPNSRNKLSLAQLEQKNNLFIRDGQQRVKNSEENSNESQMMANNKKSLIPSFLNAKTNTKVQTKGNLAEKLTKTSHKFKEFCQHKEQQQSNVKKRPPPYRPPPTPPPSTANYEEIEVENDEAASAVAKAEMFQNIPVRQRKGNVSHMENYFLFDPSVDFCNEKDLGKKIPPKIPVEMKEEKLEDVTFDDQTIYDISEHDESKNLAHHNYYEIDPELLEKEEKKPKKIYSNTLSSSSESSTTATNSSSTTTSSSDYPSLFNSVIETTHSSTIESTDENDSNGYGKVEGKCENAADSSESVITVQNVTCGENNGTGAMKKKSPQLNRIIRQSNNNKQVQNFVRKTQFDPLKASHSLPQLQRSNGNKNEVNVVIDNSMAIQLRRPHNSRQLRPLSTHSDDRDSGFLSPATPPDCQNLQIVKSGDGRSKTESTLLNQCDNIQQMIEIYTSWANYYLEHAKSKRKVVDLSTDCRDGLLLAEVIEAVTNFKVPDLIKKPKTQQQMFENVEACLNVLKQNQIGGLETITASDICSGRLKAVLSLFFSLSRYKQSSKLKAPTKAPQQLTHQAQIHHQSVQSLNSSQGDMTKERQLPQTKINGNGTAIPLPATVLVTRRSTDKSRGIPVPNGNNNNNSSSGLVRYPSGTPSSENSRPSSPPDVNKNNERLRFSQNSKIPPSPYTHTHDGSITNTSSNENNGQASSSSQQSSSNSTAKHSMLDKLKLFNKDKERSKSSKRTSSSSGFSSARSDSSLSLNNDPNAVALSKNKKNDNSRAPSAASSASSTKTSSKLREPTPGLPSAIKTQSKSEKKEKNLRVEEQQQQQMKKAPTVKFQQQQQIIQNDLRMKQQQQQPVRKIEIRTEMQQRVSMPHPHMQQKAIVQPVTTSIPKPMAAIKGTSKMMRSGGDDDMIKDKQNSNGDQKLLINSMSPLHNQLMMHAKSNGSSQSIHSTSTNNHSNSSDSSVIYRPSASESGSEFYMQQQQMLKFNTIPSKLNGHHHHHHHMAMSSNQGAIFEEQKQQSPAAGPLRSIMRNYSNSNGQHVTLPTRGARGGQNLVNGYYDENQGYCSDGDALRKTHIRYTDVENGYLSEGGVGNGNLSNSHLMSIFRNRPQLPMTIAEERCRTSKDGNLESPEMDTDNWHQRDKSLMKNGNSSKSRVKGVPQNFGYVKKCNGSSTASEVSTNAIMSNSTSRTTATVSAVPRTNKISGKVSGGTQTTNNDFQQKAMQYKSYSLTGQMSQSIKDRIAASRASSKLNDGSLSDTYSDIKDFSAYSTMWLRHSNTSSRLSDGGESIDGSMSILARNQRLIQHRNSAQSPGLKLNRSNSIRSTKSEKTYPSMLSRAVMPSASAEIETEPYYCLPVNGNNNNIVWSQPTSPTPRNLTGLISPTHINSHRHIYHNKKNDEVHGSQISLMSGGSSMYGSTTEEQRQANEVRRLKRELAEAREQVMSLSSQLSTNAHVVNAFEKSLATMTNRLQSLTAATEKKESEITEMRQTIELLKKQSIQAGLTSAHIESMGVQANGEGSPSKKSISNNNNNGSIESGLHNGNGNGMMMQRQLSTDSVCSINSLSSNCSTQDKKKKKGWLRSSFTKAFTRNAKISKTTRQASLNGNLSDSKASLPPPTPQKIIPKMPTVNTVSSDLGKPPISPTKTTRQVTLIENAKPYDSIEIENHPIVEELKKQLREKDMVLTDIRLEALTQASQMETLKETVKAMRAEMMALKQNNDRLQKIMTHRSLAGSENSLGCPASPCSNGDSRRYSFATDSGHSRPPLDLPDNLDETEEEDDVPTPAPAPLSPQLIHDISPTLERMSLNNEILTTPVDEITDAAEGKRISIAVFLGHSERFVKYMEEINECEHFNDVEDGLQQNGDSLKFNSAFNHSHDDANHSETVISYTYISGKTTWQNLDYIVRKTFKDYLTKIDPGTNLGLNTDSISSYHLGEAKRGPEMGFPELLPCGYIIGSVKTLFICLQGVSSLAFDTLVPRSIVHRYINLLTEHRRLILCGPKGTGKSFLARKLAEFLVAKSERSSIAESIATFNVDYKSSKDLQQYLSQIAEQASINSSIEELPSVIILDNLHHASELGDVFSCLLSAGPASKLPCIIGTMSQATCNTTNLQLHHNFRWVLTANHMEPVKGFLGRFLRRKLYDMELLSGTSHVQMEKIYRWLPSLVQHINSFLETHSSSDVTIGPQQFLECPLDIVESQNWFLNLWNNQLAPYMIDAIKEGVQLYGKRGNAWTDPCLYIRETYPWPVTPSTVPKLKTISAQDVGLEESDALSGNKEDPLLNMLNQLKEAASWNEIQQQDDSDCVSIDSNFTHDSSVADN